MQYMRLIIYTKVWEITTKITAQKIPPFVLFGKLLLIILYAYRTKSFTYCRTGLQGTSFSGQSLAVV